MPLLGCSLGVVHSFHSLQWVQWMVLPARMHIKVLYFISNTCNNTVQCSNFEQGKSSMLGELQIPKPLLYHGLRLSLVLQDMIRYIHMRVHHGHCAQMQQDMQ